MNVLTVLCRGGWMPGNLSEGWRRLGCSVEEFFYGTHMGKSWDRDGTAENRAINAQLWATAQRLKSEGRLDLVFMVIYDDVLDVDTAKKLRSLGVPLVNYHVDLVGQWYRVLRTAKYFDRIACAHRDHWGALVRAGARPYYMPMAANPLPEPGAVALPEFAFPGVLYLGSPMPYRRQVLGELIADGLATRIYGHNWDIVRDAARAGKDVLDPQSPGKNLHDARHYLLARIREEGPGAILASLRGRLQRSRQIDEAGGDFPPGVLRGVYASEDFVPLVRGAGINLGFTHFLGTPGTASERRQVRLREFEIPMAGGFYLTQDCPQLRELFEVGRHIDTWDNAGDLQEKCRHYLDHDDLRRRMAQEAQAHCLANHTWERRMADLLADLGLPGPRPGQAPAARTA
jgi:hypothetical protein